MKATVSHDTIQLAVKLTNAARNAYLPILGQVKVRTFGDKLEIVGTDLETSTKITLPALVEEEGAALMSFPTVKKVVESAKKGNCVAFSDDSVRAGRASANTPSSFDMDDFPGIPRLDDEKCSARFASANHFIRQMGNALKTASNDGSKTIIRAVNVSHDRGAARLVATDSYRLYVGSHIGSFEGDGTVNIPREMAEIVMKSEKSLFCVSFHDHGEHIRAVMDLGHNFTCEVISRSVEGNYPNWKQLVVDDYDYSCGIERKQLDEGSKFIKKMASVSTAVTLDLDGGKVTGKYGDDTYSYDVDFGKTDDPHARIVNVAYLIEALATSKEKTVTLKTLDSPHKPMVFENPEGDMMLVMPVRAA